MWTLFNAVYSKTCNKRTPWGTKPNCPLQTSVLFTEGWADKARHLIHTPLGTIQIVLSRQVFYLQEFTPHRFYCTLRVLFSFMHYNVCFTCFTVYWISFSFMRVGPVRAVSKLVGQRSKVRWFGPGLDSDHLLSPITINWFAGVSIIWPAAHNMLRCLWA
jgi:hypothetical protein